MAKHKKKPEPGEPDEKDEGLDAFDAAIPAPEDAPEPEPEPQAAVVPLPGVEKFPTVVGAPKAATPPLPYSSVPTDPPKAPEPHEVPTPPEKTRRAVVTVPNTHMAPIDVDVPASLSDDEARALAIVLAARKVGVTEIAPGRFGWGAGPAVAFPD